MKKAIAIMLCFIMCASFAACSKKDDKNETTTKPAAGEATELNTDFKTPEEMIEKTFNPILNGTIDWAAYWDNYLSKTSKDLKYLTKDEFVSNMRKKYPVLNKGYTSLTVKDRQNVDKNASKVTFVLKFYNSSEEIVERELTEFVIKESGEYKLVYDGIFRWKSYESQPNEDEISVTQVDVKYCYEKVNVDVTFLNNADMGRFVGTTVGAGVSVKTDKETYKGRLENVFVVKSKTSNVATAEFKDINGNLKSFSIVDIYEIDENGKAVFTGDGGITFTLPLA